MRSAVIFIVVIAGVLWIMEPAMASGVAARRNPSTGKPTIQGPPIELGPQKRQVYIPPQKKSVNLPAVLPFERKEETPKPVIAPVKKPEPVYQTQVLSSSSSRSGSNQTNSSSAALRSDASPAGRSASAVSSQPIPAEFNAFLERFDRSSEPWVQINDIRVKALIVNKYTDLYKQFGVLIRKPSVYYVNLIDSMSQNNPQLLAQPFDQVLRVVAILEYDYTSGENKDALAASILPDKRAFLQNKQRLGLK